MDLLTGATGFLGSHLARRLAAEGRPLRALVRPGTDLQRIPPEVSEVVWGGFDEPEALGRATAGADVVFHTAARVAAAGTRAQFHTDNVLATEALLEAAQAAGVRRFVHVSSAGIYGADAARDVITEATPLDPQIEKRGAYAWSKAEADRLVRDVAARGRLDALVVRPGILYGLGTKTFIARLTFAIPGGSRRRVIVGARDTLLPLTYVENACDAIVRVALHGEAGRAYNIVDGVVGQAEYLDRLAQAGGTPGEPLFVPALALLPAAVACELAGRLARRNLPLTRYKLRRATESLRYDTSAAEDLGWRPEVGLAEALRRTFGGDPRSDDDAAANAARAAS